MAASAADGLGGSGLGANGLGPIGTSQHLGQSLARAERLARDQGHPTVTIEHLLFALTDDPDAAVVLQASNVDLDRLRTDASAHLAGVTAGMAAPSTAPPRPDPELVRILHVAGSAARQSPRKQIDGAIILAAVIGDGKSSAAGLLRVHGLTFEEAIKVLQRSYAQQQASGARPSAGVAPVAAPGSPPVAPVVESVAVKPKVDPVMPVAPPVAAPPPAPSATPAAAVVASVASEAPLPLRPTASQISAASTDTLLASVRSRLQGEPAVRPVTEAGSAAAPRGLGERLASAQVDDGKAGASGDAAVRPVVPPAMPTSVDAGLAPAGRATGIPIATVKPPPTYAVPRGVAQPGSETRPVPPPAPPSSSPPVQSATPPALPPTLPPTSQPAPSSPPLAVGRTGSAPLNRPPVPFPQRLPEADVSAHAARADAGVSGRPSAAPRPYAEQDDGDVRDGGLAGPPYPSPDDVHVHAASVMPARVPTPQRMTAALDLVRATAGLAKSMTVAAPTLVEVRIPRVDVGAPNPKATGAFEHAVALRLKSMDGRSVIEPDTPELMWLTGGSPTSYDDVLIWRWRVTPRLKGRGRLHFQASVRSLARDGRMVDIPVPDHIAEVRMRPNRRAALLKVFGLVAAMLAGYFFAIVGEGLFWPALGAVRRMLGL